MNDIISIKKALQSPRVIDEKSDIVYNFMVGLITKIHAISGKALEDIEIMNALATELQKDVLTRFKGLTLQEIDIAITNGIKGDYGEYYGINIRSFNNFLNEYTFSEERGKALEARMERVDASKLLSAKGCITREESERTAYDNAIDLFEEYKRTKECPDHGNIVYSYLDKLGLIKFDAKEKWGMMSEAEKMREKERREKSVTIANIIEQQQECGIVVVYAKRIALRRFFGYLLKSGTELKTILEKNHGKRDKV